MTMSVRLCAMLCCAAVVAMPLAASAGEVSAPGATGSTGATGDVPAVTGGDAGGTGRGENGLISNRSGSCPEGERVQGRQLDGRGGVASFPHVAAMDAGPAAVHFRLAETLFRAGRLDAALSSYTLAITLEPDHAGALHGRWKLCSRLSLHRQALKDMSRLIELIPGRADYHYERARTLLKLNRVREAYRDFLRAYELDRRYPRPTLLEDDAPTGKVLVADWPFWSSGRLKLSAGTSGGGDRFRIAGRACADA